MEDLKVKNNKSLPVPSYQVMHDSCQTGAGPVTLSFEQC